MTIDSLNRLSSAQLQRATDLKERIEKLEQELEGLFDAPAPKTKELVVRKRRKMSAAARARIGAAATARWAKIRAAKKN